MKRYALLILRFRIIIIISVVLITAVMAYFARDIKVNADVMSYLPEEDKAAALFNRIGETYGGNEIMIIGLETEEVFDHRMLMTIKQITDSLRATEGIGHVTSLTSVLDIRGSDLGIEIGRLVDEYDIPESEEELLQLREYTLSMDMYRGSLVSEDGTATLITGKILTGVNRTEVAERVRERVESIPFEGRIFYGGMPITLLELNNIIIKDIRFIIPLAFVVISLVLLAGFRRPAGVFIPMMCVIIAITWTLGTISVMGYEITLLTNIIPVILTAVGSAYAIHVVNAVMAEQQEQGAGAVKKALSRITIPVILASTTTIIGFLSFIAGSYLTMIRQFGLFSALGILFSMILAVSFVPAVMSFSSVPAASTKNPGIFDLIPRKLSGVVFINRRLILGIWAAVICLSLIGITRIERRVNITDYFKDGNIVKQGEELLVEKFHGSNPLYVRVKGDVQSPQVLSLMSYTQDYMEGFSYITYSRSVADMIKQMNDAMGEGKRIPDDHNMIVQLWFLLDGQEIMEQLVSYDLSEGIVYGYVSSDELHLLREIDNNFEEFSRNHSSDQVELSVTGIPVMLRRLDDSIIKSQTYSLILAIFLVVMMTSLLLGSLRLGLLAIIPIIITLAVLFGTMGLSGIPLDIATVLSGSVTIGIGIDYSVHFISRFREGLSIDRAVRISGKAIFINMIAVTAGFAMLSLSSLVPLQRFGLLIAATMLTAGLATLTLLPLMLTKGEK